VICGAGKVLQTPRGVLRSQRAEHIWELSSPPPVAADHQQGTSRTPTPSGSGGYVIVGDPT
jgi:hypothetical protein